jgi:hypothetical protein
LKSVGPNASAGGGIGTRTAVMGLFGMMNWLYTWYKPRVDPDAEVLAREISDIFLRGIRGDADAEQSIRGNSRAAKKLPPKQKQAKRRS